MEKSVQSQGWIEAVKKVYENGGNVFAGHLQEKYPHLYEQGIRGRALPCWEAVSQLSFRGEAEKSLLRMWLKTRDPSLRSG